MNDTKEGNEAAEMIWVDSHMNLPSEVIIGSILAFSCFLFSVSCLRLALLVSMLCSRNRRLLLPKSLKVNLG